MKQLSGEDWITSPGKRSIDLALASTLAPVGLPLAVGAAALIKVVDGVDPLYSQERVGINNEPFTIFKLRTMPGVVDHIPSVGGHEDVRASKIGRILRKFRLDEVPQIWNIYRGDMSVVGPRPIVLSEYESIMDSINPADQKAWRYARKVCKPGMIDQFGINAYIDGYDFDAQERVEADLNYLETASFRGDVRLITSSLGLFSNIIRNGNNDIDKATQELPHQYRRGASTLLAAANAFGVDIEPEEFTYWDSIFRLVRVLDKMVDEQGVKDLTDIVENVVMGLPAAGIDKKLILDFSRSISRMSGDKKADILFALQKIPHFAELKKASVNAKDLTKVCLEEAKCFSSILELSTLIDSDGSRERFNFWLSHVAQVGEAFDSIVDMRQDYQDGLISIRPTILNYLTIARGGLSHVRRATSGMDIKTTKKLISCGWSCFTD